MISVNPHFTEEGLDQFYNRYYENRVISSELGEQRKAMYKQDRDWILNYISKGKVLDIGCSGGNFLGTFDSNNWDKYGIDLTDDALESAARNYNIKTFKGRVWETDVGDDYELVFAVSPENREVFHGIVEKHPLPVTEIGFFTEIRFFSCFVEIPKN